MIGAVFGEEGRFKLSLRRMQSNGKRGKIQFFVSFITLRTRAGVDCIAENLVHYKTSTLLQHFEINTHNLANAFSHNLYFKIKQLL